MALWRGAQPAGVGHVSPLSPRAGAVAASGRGRGAIRARDARRLMGGRPKTATVRWGAGAGTHSRALGNGARGWVAAPSRWGREGVRHMATEAIPEQATADPGAGALAAFEADLASLSMEGHWQEAVYLPTEPY